MKCTTNDITISTRNGNIKLSIGGLYIIKKPYKYMQFDSYEESMDVIAVMPIAISNNTIYFSALYVHHEDGIYLKEIIDNTINLNILMGEEDEVSIILNKYWLYTLMSRINSSNKCSVVYNVGVKIVAYSNTLVCSTKNIEQMFIEDINISMYDMRNWPKESLHIWAFRHLSCSTPQLNSLYNIKERWKLIAAAQEMFTEKCSEYNIIAKEKIAAARKKYKEENAVKLQIDRLIDRLDLEEDVYKTKSVDGIKSILVGNYTKRTFIDTKRRKEDYFINGGFLGLNSGIINTYTMPFVSPIGHRNNVVHLSVEPESIATTSRILQCKFNGRNRKTIVNGDFVLYITDECIIYIDGFYIHICKDLTIDTYGNSIKQVAHNEDIVNDHNFETYRTASYDKDIKAFLYSKEYNKLEKQSFREAVINKIVDVPIEELEINMEIDEDEDA